MVYSEHGDIGRALIERGVALAEFIRRNDPRLKDLVRIINLFGFIFDYCRLPRIKMHRHWRNVNERQCGCMAILPVQICRRSKLGDFICYTLLC